MIKLDRTKKVLELLKRDYPKVKTPLYHQTIFQLTVATILSAQTLDASVNKVTPMLFAKYPTAVEMSQANPLDIEKIIRIVNYHKTKSVRLVEMGKRVLSNFNGKIPNTINELITFPGVGRKVANVVIAEWFAQPVMERINWPLDPLPGYIENRSQINDTVILSEGFVVDTHVIRTANRLGLTNHKDPKKIEQDLMKIFPRSEWNSASLRLIFHGRLRCKARDNQCCGDPEWGLVCNCF